MCCRRGLGAIGKPPKQELDICCSSRLYAGGLRRLALPRGRESPLLQGFPSWKTVHRTVFQFTFCRAPDARRFRSLRRATRALPSTRHLFLREKGGRKNLLLRTYHFNKVKARSSTKVAVITSLCATDKRTAAAVNSDLSYNQHKSKQGLSFFLFSPDRTYL